MMNNLFDRTCSIELINQSKSIYFRIIVKFIFAICRTQLYFSSIYFLNMFGVFLSTFILQIGSFPLLIIIRIIKIYVVSFTIVRH